MLYRIGALVVLLVHLAFVLFVVLGGVIALRWPKVAWAHIPVAVWGALIEFTGGICPLTPLENWLREQAGEERYAGDFIEHYITALIYPGGLTREIQIGLGVFVVVLNVAIYVWIATRRRESLH
jgi:hypothetical protein